MLKDKRAPGGASLLRRYAQECRTLAYECAEGTAPPFITGSFEESYGRCAIGWVLHRVNPRKPAQDVFWAVYNAVWKTSGGVAEPTPRERSPDAAVIDANNKWPTTERHGAVVFPLLWLADSVDATARRGSAAKGRPQKAIP